MRTVLIATLVAAGIGLAGTSAGSAAPVNNTVLKQIAKMSSSATEVGWRGRHRCHVRWRSWWHWC